MNDETYQDIYQVYPVVRQKSPVCLEGFKEADHDTAGADTDAGGAACCDAVSDKYNHKSGVSERF